MFYIYCSVKTLFLKSPLNKTEEKLVCILYECLFHICLFLREKKKKLHTSLLRMFRNDKKATPAKDALEKII